MAWYEYTTWKNNIAAMAADWRKFRDWLTRRQARRDEAINAELRAEIGDLRGKVAQQENDVLELIDKGFDLRRQGDVLLEQRLTVIEKKLDIPTGFNRLAGPPFASARMKAVAEEIKAMDEPLVRKGLAQLFVGPPEAPMGEQRECPGCRNMVGSGDPACHYCGHPFAKPVKAALK